MIRASALTLSLIAATVALAGPTAASPIDACLPGVSSFAEVTLCATSRSGTVFVPALFNGPGIPAELQEWQRPLPTGGSFSITCLDSQFFDCEPSLEKLGFEFASVVLPVTIPTFILGETPECGIEIYNADLTVKALGTGVEDVPVVAGGLTFAGCNIT